MSIRIYISFLYLEIQIFNILNKHAHELSFCKTANSDFYHYL